MDSKSAIFIVLGSLLIMAIYSPIMNFVSAAFQTTCYTSGEKYVCIHVFDDPPPTSAITFCNPDGTNCKTTWLDKVPPLSPAYKAALRNLQLTYEETQTNTNDSKDLGGMKTDKGITKSPIG